MTFSFYSALITVVHEMSSLTSSFILFRFATAHEDDKNENLKKIYRRSPFFWTEAKSVPKDKFADLGVTGSGKLTELQGNNDKHVICTAVPLQHGGMYATYWFVFI